MSAEILDDLAISHAAFGVAIGAFFISNSILSPAAGRLVDRLGGRNSVRLVAALLVLSMLGIASFGANYAALVVFLLIGGLAAALGGPTGSLLLAGVGGPMRQPLLFGVRQAFVPAASLIGGIAVPILAAAALGWRWAFFIGGVLVLALAFPARFESTRRATFHSHSPSKAYRVHELWLLAVGLALAGSAATSLTSFIVDYAVSRGMTVETGGSALAIGSAAAIATRVAAGYWVGRLRLDALEVTAGILLVGVGGFVWILAGTGPDLLMASVLALAGAWGCPGLVIYAVTFGFRESPGRANGIVQGGGAAGGVLGPILTGWAVENFSYMVAWAMSAVLLLAAAAIVVVLCVRRRQLAGASC